MSKRKIRLELAPQKESSDTVLQPVLPAFPWYDKYFLSNQNVDRLKEVARAACLIEDLMTTAQEHSPEGVGWVSCALGQALRAISDEPEGSSVGALLAALEAIVPTERRALWPQ